MVPDRRKFLPDRRKKKKNFRLTGQIPPENFPPEKKKKNFCKNENCV
jgi:hypothetical protein